MGKVSKSNNFNISDITSDNIKNITVNPVAHSQGRRFVIKMCDPDTNQSLSSGKTTLHKIYNQTNNLINNEPDIEKLKAIKSFLENLKEIDKEEENASLSRQKTDFIYKIFTFFPLLVRHNHNQNITDLISEIDKNIQVYKFRGELASIIMENKTLQGRSLNGLNGLND